MTANDAHPQKTRAIMFSDIKGYSRLMGADEAHALKLLDEHNALVVPLVESHGGVVLKFIGDAVLSAYESAADAVRCGLAIQRALAERNRAAGPESQILVRIGIHVGDVVLKQNDVFGDGVNIAARLEPLAEPGGICISQTVYDMVRARPEIQTVHVGAKELKNISGTINVYRVIVDALEASAAQRAPRPAEPAVRRRRMLAGAGSLLLLALAGAGWWAWQRGRAPSQGTTTGWRDDIGILVARLHVNEAAAEPQARALEGMVARALERFVERAPTVRVLADGSAPRTEQEARALGVASGADLVVWGELNLIGEEFVLEPLVTATRRWALPADTSASPGTLRWPRAGASALDARRADAAYLGRPAALAAASLVADTSAALAILDDLGSRDEFTERLRGTRLSALGKHEEAEQVLRAAIGKWPRSFQLHLALSRLLVRYRARDAGAQVDATAALATEAVELARVAQVYATMGNGARAEAVWREALRRFPGDKYVALSFAVELGRLHRLDEARGLVASSAREPMTPDEAILAVRALMALQDDDAARPIVRRLVRDEDLTPQARAGQALLLVEGAAPVDRDLAVVAARRAMKEAPTHVGVLENAGQVLLEAGLEREGLAVLRTGVDLAPNGAGLLTRLGSALLEKEPGAARGLLLRAVKAEPPERTLPELARDLLALREPAAALEAVGLARGAAASGLDLLALRCDALTALGRRAEALATAAALAAATAPDYDRGQLAAFACSARAGAGEEGRAALRAALPGLSEAGPSRIARFLLGELGEEELAAPEGELSAREVVRLRCAAGYFTGVAALFPAGGAPDPQRAARAFRESVGTPPGSCGERPLAELERYRLEPRR